MKLTVEKESFLEALDLASRFVSKSSTLPILENVYIWGYIDSLIIKASDMGKYIQITLPAQIENEWAITVNARSLLDIVRNVDDEQIVIEWKDDGSLLTLLLKTDKFDFIGISANEYIAIPDIKPEWTTSIDPSILAKWIEKVEYAVADKSLNAVATWVLFKFVKDELRFVGTDNFRLAEYKVKVENNSELELIVPKDASSEIRKVAEFFAWKWWETVKIEYEKNLVGFQFTQDKFDIYVKTNLIQWQFPDYEKFIMPTYNSKYIVDKNIMEKAVKKVSLFSKTINYFIKLIPEEDKLNIVSWLTDLGEWNTQIPAIVDWEMIAIWMNGKHILDFIRNLEWEELIFNILWENSPVLILDKSDDNYRYITRPLKDEERG